MTESSCGKRALLALRIRRRLGSPHDSRLPTPSHGQDPLHDPRARSCMRAAWLIALLTPHSHEIQISSRSPLVPCSSIQSCRTQSVFAPWTNSFQSMSPTCPLRQARTKRTGTTDCFLRVSGSEYLSPSSDVRWTRRLFLWPRGVSSVRCTMNHSGKRQATTFGENPKGRSKAGGARPHGGIKVPLLVPLDPAEGLQNGLYERGLCVPFSQPRLAVITCASCHSGEGVGQWMIGYRLRHGSPPVTKIGTPAYRLDHVPVPGTPRPTPKPPRRTANPMHRADDARFRQALLEWREESGLSQRDMAERIGRSLAWVNRCETGGRRMDALEWLDWLEACGIRMPRALRRLGRAH